MAAKWRKAQGEHKRPEYLAKQRFGQVPLLVDSSNGRHLCQSAAILEYLADKTGKFGGANLQERMDAREWVFWEFDRLSKGVFAPAPRSSVSPSSRRTWSPITRRTGRPR